MDTVIRKFLLSSTLACAALLIFAPLLRSESCDALAGAEHGDGYVAVYMGEVSPRGFVLGQFLCGAIPLVGTYFACMTSATIASLVLGGRRTRADTRCHIVRWVAVYISALLVQAVAISAMVWLHEACPSNFPIFFKTLFVTKCLANVLQIVVLMWISILRLRILGEEAAEVRGFWLMVSPGSAVIGSLVAGISGQGVVCAGARALAVSLLFLFHCNSAWGMGLALRQARIEAHGTANAARALWGTKFELLCSIASSVSTVMFLMSWCLHGAYRLASTHAAFELSGAVGSIANTAFALSCAGLIGPERGAQWSTWDSESSDHQILGFALRDIDPAFAERKTSPLIKDALRMMATSPACTLASLFAGTDEKELISCALAKFRSISWDILKRHPHLVVDGEALDGGGPGPRDLYKLSEPCQPGCCDVFWSHSWHDLGELKWESLRTWCEAFEQEHGRAPRIWFDKVCIDQADVSTDLKCLPIFLASCNTLLVTAGETYIYRLWCCTELFVYMAMLIDGDSPREQPVIDVIGCSPGERSRVLDAWRHFQIENCDCAKATDKERILAITEKQAGSNSLLSVFVKRVGQRLSSEDVGAELEASDSYSISHSISHMVSITRSDPPPFLRADAAPKRIICV